MFRLLKCNHLLPSACRLYPSCKSRLLPRIKFPNAIRQSMFTSPPISRYQKHINLRSRLTLPKSITADMSESTNKISSLGEGTDLQEELAKKAEEYTTTLGSYTAWRTDVNLNPPDAGQTLSKDDEHIYDYYNALQYSLFENNLPETVDRSSEPRKKGPRSSVSIVLLSSPVECLAILTEGGRQCPGDMLLVLSPTWLIKDKSKSHEGLHSLYVKKAITFSNGGCSFIDVFETPRRCTYFVNYFTRSCTDGQRNDGEEVELDLDCPMSSSIELCKRVDDKLLTRIWMAEAGVHYPETLALVYKPPYEYRVPNDASIQIITIENKDEVSENVKNEVKHFLKSKGIQVAGQVVVKPSGMTWHGSRCVTFHDVNDVDEIYTAVINLLKILEVENAVLVEAFHRPPTSENPEVDDYSYRLRVNVCRQTDNTSVSTQMVCGIGKKNQPINGDNTIPLTFDTTMEVWGINEKDRQRLFNVVKQGSERILNKIIEYERTLSADIRGGPGAQTDLIGIDYVLSEINGSLEPVGIEVNSHDCTINCQLFENLNTHRQGEAVKPLVETMIRRSQMFAIKDKTVLVVGAGGFSKQFIWDTFPDFGIKVILVDPDKNCYAASKASGFIQYNFVDHKHDAQHADNLMQILKEKNMMVDGCITFWEDCGPLAATISERLNLRGPGMQAACVAKKKSLTQKVLRSKTGDVPHFPRTYLYSGNVAQINNETDIDNAIDQVGLPAVLKLEYGSSAVGVKPVKDRMGCVNAYNQIKSSLRTEEDHPGIGLGYGNDLLLMERLPGTEHDIDIIIYNRQLVAAFVSDNGPTRDDSFTETTASMPTSLPLDRQGQIVIAAYQCCTEIGLVDGVFNVEMIMTTNGPKLIEINARMGGFYLRDWILVCYGVDLLLASFMISLRVCPIIPKPVPRGHLMGTMCVPSLHKRQFEDINNLKVLERLVQNGTIQYNQIEASMEDCGKEGEEEPFCNIAVMAADRAQAKEKLIAVCNALGLSSSRYDLDYYLKHFR